LVERDAKVLAFDPQGDYRGGAWVNARSRDEAEAAIMSQWRGDVRVSYTPDLGECDPVDEAAWLAETARIVQRQYPAHDPRPLTLLIDEAHLALPVERARSRDARALKFAILQGRHSGIGMTFVTQRPANVSKDARAQAMETYAFWLSDEDDRRVIGKMHRSALKTFDDLEKFQFMRIAGRVLEACQLETASGIKVLKPAE
ncbi:MAG: zonular occludens toxin domain-containing protein, partial [Hyphococcus sp.]